MTRRFYRITNDPSGSSRYTKQSATEEAAWLREQGHEGVRVVRVKASARAREHDRHLYTHGAEPREMREFEERYGKKKGDYVYGATVGKVKRERAAKRGA